MFNYSFSVWPDETRDFPQALFKLFGFFNTRVEMELTEEEFNKFKSHLNGCGFRLAEIERTIWQKPEKVWS